MKSETNIFTNYEVLNVGVDKYQFRINKKLAEYQKEQQEGVTETIYVIASYLLDDIFIGTEQEANEYIEANYQTLINLYVSKSYGDRISELIREQYSQDRVEALNYNYLADKETYQAEVDEFQAYRNQCKQTAKEEYYPELNR